MTRDRRHILYDLGEDQYSLKGIWLLALLFFGSLISGAVLSLIAFKITHFVDPDASSYLASKPYPKFFDRARWVSVLFLLPYLFVKCRITSFRAIGFAKPFAATFGLWFVSGIAMIFIIYGFNTATGAFAINPEWSAGLLLKKADDAILAALLIGTLEEIVFRGLVFRMFYTAMKPLPALLCSSFFFALLHFKTPEFALGHLAPSEIGAAQAAQIAFGTAVAVFTEFDLKYLLAIFLVGVALHQVFLLGRNLWASIAIHAGWVFTIKLFGSAFVTTDQASSFSGTTRVADGYWVSMVLVVFIAGFALLLKRKEGLSRETP
ncbi:CPBP family intramembrane glutamic endopeptidase [Pelagicoccus sp. SDUM812003]|uniref:CPBP family intramembrane glutamic endopeptidase n=1 Tax=Pelagicoccus sp. SDUM812003 TaxID=3041267 RepID=UPI002810439A|nr:CPBP family intramembrane glutamic endopeptidase [Pelagicoccus sp. SDUM812003]MDQ8204384.1 CPBP family intramembrane metalloprotease [Pelagicoccus sp. SDUM812003]